MSPLLKVEDLYAGYGDVRVLEGIDLEVEEGGVVSVVGANGAGKTTLLKAISGLVPPSSGRIEFDGRDLGSLKAHAIVAAGAVMVPEGRRLFPELTVWENIRLGAYHREARRELDSTMEEVLELFPTMAERREQPAGSLSGGEQQMCALARGLMARPRLLMLDEPSLGLAPAVVERVFGLVQTLAERGLTVLLVEQNVGEALELSDTAYVLEQGRMATHGPARTVLEDPAIQAAYLGIS